MDEVGFRECRPVQTECKFVRIVNNPVNILFVLYVATRGPVHLLPCIVKSTKKKNFEIA